MKNSLLLFVLFGFVGCSKSNKDSLVAGSFTISGVKINNADTHNNILYNVNYNPVIKITFSAPVDHATVSSNVIFSPSVPFMISYTNNDSVLVIQPNATLLPLSRYRILVLTTLKSQQNINLSLQGDVNFLTQIDSTDKFPQLTDSDLLDLVQKQTFKYFWDFGHPVSGMARERNSSGETVTTGGTGFGIMAIPVAISRNFISRTEGLTRVSLIVNFLKNNCTKYHGAFSHWINGTTGATIPFSSNDNGADLVETSYLMQGLLVARQYFNSSVDPAEIDLRNKINQLWDAVEWNWFRKNNENVLYWHWSPDQGFAINAQVSGWNEALITYIMASSSRTDSIAKTVYDNGWAGNGSMQNNNLYYGYQLPLGPANGGPLFFEHYSFMGINPNGLNDAYANYQNQTTNHTKINYEYCRANPQHFFGYSSQCWGLTASDIPNDGYHASEPNSDIGVIAPTAALSSFAYTPVESMQALKFFYYKLGDKLWGEYGFYDAFSLKDAWFANSTLAIDQGPVIVMIENYRTSLVWNLFTSCPEIKNGMRRLGFTAPYL